MSARRPKLGDVVAALEGCYGAQDPPLLNDPWDPILWENVAYLANDTKRAAAFQLLKESVGTQPEQILAAPDAALLAVARHGIMPQGSAKKLRDCARILLDKFGGSLAGLGALSLQTAKKALRKFPGLGETGAEKILLFAGIHRLPASDSNGLRVMIRLGFGEESANYTAMYRSAQKDVSAELLPEAGWLILAYQLLRLHGQEICRRNRPECEQCVLTDSCRYYSESASLTSGQGQGMLK